jgi:hypothetical protein
MEKLSFSRALQEYCTVEACGRGLHEMNLRTSSRVGRSARRGESGFNFSPFSFFCLGVRKKKANFDSYLFVRDPVVGALAVR